MCVLTMTPALCASDVSAVLKRRPTDTMREIYYTVPSIINFYDDINIIK